MHPEKVPRRKLPRRRVVRRERYILDACAGKRVLHVGCTDAPFTEWKFEKGTLLHQRLDAVTERLVGLDLDGESIRWLQERGVPDLYVADAATVGELLPEIDFEPDLVVAGEVIEHLSQPVDFLRGIGQLLQKGAELILSVPNAFAFESLVHVLLGAEKVHGEHVAYYSPQTIRELLRRASLRVEEIRPCNHEPLGGDARLPRLARDAATWVFPYLATGYVARAAADGDAGWSA